MMMLEEAEGVVDGKSTLECSRGRPCSYYQVASWYL
jgi:hypothetical protein